MKKVLIGFIGLVMVFVSCYRIDEYEIVRYKAPNWTSDGRIVFVEDYNFVRDIYHPLFGITDTEGYEELTLCEIDYGGKNLKQIIKLAKGEGHPHCLGITSTSSAGEWVAVAMRTYDSDYDEIFMVKRDGTGLTNLGEGTYPDLSPDAQKIVYQKPNQGLWIKNIDGSGDRQIVAKENTMQPAWSSDGGRIAYTLGITTSLTQDSLCISDTAGILLDGFMLRINAPDWGPVDSNAVCASNGNNGMIIHLNTHIIDTLYQISIGDAPLKWSPDGGYFIAYDAGGYYVVKRDGSNKWYLKP